MVEWFKVREVGGAVITCLPQAGTDHGQNWVYLRPQPDRAHDKGETIPVCEDTDRGDEKK